MTNSSGEPAIDRSTFCPGHYDDDSALLAGVSIGEPVYCDGSCSDATVTFLEHIADERKPGDRWERVYESDLPRIPVGARLRVDHLSGVSITMTVAAGYGLHGCPQAEGLLCRIERSGRSWDTVLAAYEFDSQLVWLDTEWDPSTPSGTADEGVSGDLSPSPAGIPAHLDGPAGSSGEPGRVGDAS